MIRMVLLAAWGALLFAGGPACAQTVTLDTRAATAVLDALGNPTLSRDEALRIAALEGNRELIRKAVSYHVPATEATFADALVAAAKGQSGDPAMARAFRFNEVKADRAVLVPLIARITAEPERFRDWVRARVARFTPAQSPAAPTGYLVVGGQSGGFSFGEPAFTLNLAYFHDFDTARVVMAHELYHAIQGFYSVNADDRWLKPAAPDAPGKAHQAMCANLASLFTSLYEEGSADYVGDPLLLDPAGSAEARKVRSELETGLNQMGAHRTLLELSVTGIEARDPVPYEAIYALDFYVPEPLYKLGYAMARAIAQDRGDAALAAALGAPGYAFARAYVQLPRYGKDYEHPVLGPHALAAIALLERGCPGEAQPG